MHQHITHTLCFNGLRLLPLPWFLNAKSGLQAPSRLVQASAWYMLYITLCFTCIAVVSQCRYSHPFHLMSPLNYSILYTIKIIIQYFFIPLDSIFLIALLHHHTLLLLLLAFCFLLVLWAFLFYILSWRGFSEILLLYLLPYFL